MNLKEKLFRHLKEKVSQSEVKKEEQPIYVTPICLNDKVDEFINWYSEKMCKGNYTDIGEYHAPIKMRDFIEKMAVWYELRYPDYEVNRLMPGSGQEYTEVSRVMLEENSYVKEMLGENSDVCYLDWSELYNIKAFINSLPYEERCFFMKPRYPEIVYYSRGSGPHFHLSSKGTILEADFLDYVKGPKGEIISTSEVEGKHITEAIKFMKDRGIEFPENSEMIEAKKIFENRIHQRKEMLNCVMYRIIERGGNRIGPRRGFLFAKEFDTNINIPMLYGVDFSDPGLRSFMNEYIKVGGSKEMICYENYFTRASKEQKVTTITVQELILTCNNDAATFYTPEETELHQKLVNVLVNNINPVELKKEQIKLARIKRKII